MDIVSHGLWGALAGRKSRASFGWLRNRPSAPDLFSFGILWVAALAAAAAGFQPMGHRRNPPSRPMCIISAPSPIQFRAVFAVFALLWLPAKKPVWELRRLGLVRVGRHSTHSFAFFPTPFLWPLLIGSSTAAMEPVGHPHPKLHGAVLFYGWSLLGEDVPPSGPNGYARVSGTDSNRASSAGVAA